METIVVLQDVFRDVLDEPDLTITHDTTPDDLADWDSLTMVKLIVSIEATLGIEVDPERVGEIQSVGDLARLIEQT